MKENAILQYFKYDHLPEHLQRRSQPFAKLAKEILRTTPTCPEQTVALRKLLEAKDAAVRAGIFKEPGEQAMDPIANVPVFDPEPEIKGKAISPSGVVA